MSYEVEVESRDELGGFELVDEARINSLGLHYQAWQHGRTGALHIHLDSGDSENVFLVGLRTVPEDSTGVAHILEHTALCGSKKYPVRDPFFMMIRRSINTFMNAFTSSDWTAYPFASANKKDFENLLSVYLDAVFASRLDAMDFQQEGVRYAFSEPEDSKSDLTYQGVVFNEMKGAMSSPSSVMWQHLTHHLFPHSTYHFNSGGSPADIPNLNHDGLLAFYHKHYHPSNAIFMTYGDLPARWYHDRIESQVCEHFSKSDERIEVLPEPAFKKPIRVEEPYASDEVKQKTYHVMAWLLNDITDHARTLELTFLARILLDHSGSPLTHVLETSELGQGTSPIEGILDDARMLSFACGIEGSERSHAAAVEKLILNTLKSIAKEGVPLAQAQAALRQFELEQREVTGGSMPYGLELILRALPGAVHYGNPREFLAIDDMLESMWSKIEDPAYIPNLIQSALLENKHRVLLTCYPDPKLASYEKKLELDKLKQIKKTMTEADKESIISMNQALLARQNQEEDLSILPEVHLDDIASEWSLAEGISMQENDIRVEAYAQPTNGLVYQTTVLPISDWQNLQALSWMELCLSGLGCGEDDYLAMQSKLYANTGGVGTNLGVVSDVSSAKSVRLYLAYSGKGLNTQTESLAYWIDQMKRETRFDEKSRIEDLLRQAYASQCRSLTGRGHEYAMMAACAGFLRQLQQSKRFLV